MNPCPFNLTLIKSVDFEIQSGLLHSLRSQDIANLQWRADHAVMSKVRVLPQSAGD